MPRRKVIEEDLEGAGFFSDVYNLGRKAVGRVKDVFKGVRRDYPPKVRQLLSVVGDQPVVQMYVRRDPIRAPLHTVLNLLTVGKWNEVRARYSYDRVFHLGLEVVVQPNPSSPISQRYVIEKNEVINVAPANAMTEDTEIVNIPMSGTTTIKTLLAGGQQRQGDKFFLYDAFTNNCQNFIEDILVAGGFATADIIGFVKQPMEGVIQELPSFVAPVARAATDVAALANVALQGQGRLIGGATHRKAVLKRYGLEDKGYSLAELSKITKVPKDILQQVYNRGIGAYGSSPDSVRLKGSFVKNVKAPMRAKLSKEQWAMSRVYSFLNGNPKHDNDLRANVTGGGKYTDQLGAILDSLDILPTPEMMRAYAIAAAMLAHIGPSMGVLNKMREKEEVVAEFREVIKTLAEEEAPAAAAAEPFHTTRNTFPPVPFRPFKKGSGTVRSFQEQLKAMGLPPERYLKEARRKAKAAGLLSENLRFSDNGTHKLTITDPEGRVRHFGRIGYGDHLIYQFLEHTKKVPAGEAASRRDRFQKSHSKIKGDWRKDPYSPNNLALSVNW